jgi:hypothetical protein
MTRAQFVSGVRALAIAYVAASCCEEPKKPCLQWLVGGETYRVELVEHFDSVNDEDFYKPPPYSGYRFGERGCGVGLDLSDGATLAITAAERTSDGLEPSCTDGCYDRRAEVTVPSVVKTGPSSGVVDIAAPYFRDQFEATMQGECPVRYTIGLMPVFPPFIESMQQPVVSDHMLFRKILPLDVARCSQTEPFGQTPGACWDSWTVRIFDESGRMVSKDVPPASVVVDAGAEAGS